MNTSAPVRHLETSYPARYPGELLVAFSRSLLDGTRRVEAAGQAASADVVRMGTGGPRSIVYLRHPDLVRAVLIDENDGVTKARGLRLAEAIVGKGLLTLEGEAHAARRRLVLPAFHHGHVRGYADTMVEQTLRETDGWTDGVPFDLHASMSRLTLGIAAQTLFGASVDRERIAHALTEASAAFDRMQHPLGELFMRLPTPNTRRSRRARAAIDAEVYRMIGEGRRTGAASTGDAAAGTLLGLLLSATDESGTPLTDTEVRDEAITLLLAGHETTAVALAWTWPLLAAHPDVLARLHEEVDTLGHPPTFDDVGRLPYTRQILAESMRLFPPAWSFARQAARDLDLDGVAVAAGTTVLLAPLFLHRDPRFWPDPERFRPERFTPEQKRARHKFAYYPFSAGRRGCIGEQFAWTEGVLVLATIAQRWRIEPAGPLPLPVGSVTYRPSGPMPARAVLRER